MMEYMLTEFAYDAKLRGPVNKVEGRAAIQRDLDKWRNGLTRTF